MVDRNLVAEIFSAREDTTEQTRRFLFDDVGWVPIASGEKIPKGPLGEKIAVQWQREHPGYDRPSDKAVGEAGGTSQMQERAQKPLEQGGEEQQADKRPQREDVLAPAPESFLHGEPQPQALRRFIGGYYVKRASSTWDQWAGIEGTVTIGEPTISDSRRSDTGRRLDGFSIYLGGNANGRGEIDAGLSWDYVQNADGVLDRKTYGWRPFFRNGSWNWCNKGDVYWKPGETVDITLNVVAPGRLRMRIADPGDNPKRVVEAEFNAPGWTNDAALQFKRVNAIDQVNNEGRPAQPTESKVLGSEWLRTDMIYRQGGQTGRVPMHAKRQARLDMPASHALIGATDQQRSIGAEKIDIYGSQSELRPRLLEQTKEGK